MRTYRSWSILAVLAAVSCKTAANRGIVKDADTTEAAAAGGDVVDGLKTVEAMIRDAQARKTPWADKDTSWPENLQPMTSTACQKFTTDLLPPVKDDLKLPEKDQSLKTDGLLIIKGGQIVFKNARGAFANKIETGLHPMWSASKSFTAGIFATLAYASAHPDETPLGKMGAKIAAHLGHPLTLETKISELLNAQSLQAMNNSPGFAALTVRQFLNMSPALHWAEDYAGGELTDSTILKMLWVPGKSDSKQAYWGGAFDMAAYAAKPYIDRPDAEQFEGDGPGSKYIYSSGNAVILMRALRDVYTDQADYDALPWTTLFDSLGMRKVAFERDPAGTYIGSSYLHTTLADMANFGFALLNGGYYKDRQVMDPKWVEEFRHVSPAQLLPGTSEDYMLEEGAFYGMGFFLNVDAKKSGRTFTPEFYAKQKEAVNSTLFFPNTPTDMFMAAGHYGQNIIIMPQLDMMLVRYGHDVEYFSKIDRMVAETLACFN